MAIITNTTLSNTIQAKYSKKLLDHAVQEVHLVEFAAKEELEAGIGATSVRFFRPNVASTTATGAPAVLAEGVAPTDYREITYTPIDVPLVQIGEVSKITDVVTAVGLLKHLDNTIALHGEDFALDVDTRIRNQLIHPSTGLTKRYAQGLANFAAVAGATTANAKLVPQDLLDAATALKIARSPKINGRYQATVPPQGTRDIMNDTTWRELIRQVAADRAFKGEVGDLFGVAILEGTNPFQEDETEGTFATSFNPAGSNTTGLIYSTIVTGKGAYGVVDMKKLGGVAKKPQVIIVDKPDSSNPLNQFMFVGWKAYWASSVLNSTWGITLRHKSQFVG